MGPIEVAVILMSLFIVLVLLRVPVSFALGLATVPIFLMHDRLTVTLLFTEMFRAYNSFLLLAVPFFLLAANLMNRAGITDRLMNFAKAIVGHLPGGLGHVNITVSMLFAGISGSSTADSAGIGAIMIPAMKKEGYDASLAVTVTACSSVMGVIIPPSVLMIIWGGVMSVSIGGLFLAGIIPGIAIGLSMMATVYVYARRRNYPRYPLAGWRAFFNSAGSALLALFTPIIIVGGISGGFFTPTEASLAAVLYSLLLGGLIYRKLDLKALKEVFYESARFSAIALFAVGTASAFAFLLAFFKVPEAIVSQLQDLSLGFIGTGMVIAAAFLLIGMFIDAIPAIIILGTVLWPVAEAAGYHPIHFAIIGVVALAFGLVTPPYGLCLLISCSLGNIRVADALRDVVIMLVPMLIVLLLIVLLPDLILWLPRLLMPEFF
ncbi:TRAP transporter large permease [Flavilitoribacter nigricans]|uniref:C4-dicarboxylate ABC transporter permease n=1 Tax=Flavilitoribacter nigricans (strain ATCC 23147 / DSM 23189 / NBRC 102662 / NCIMB 1420 / SS-2) TaxID=1122177 RepID=A0A2D0NCK9_FLAN2|nr:TRAP transporter large permease [Flavilitoribacter nigricans]PHN05503.1 C4-dicarboxylate ABC transporter permease [Flavilitoribacter nigricans DSM 23189 = NBRC 102662]